MSNILPKKSWHVYNDENKEKVRHDEEQARLIQEAADARASQAERDARLSCLRSRARRRIDPDAPELMPASTTHPEDQKNTHFVLFEENGGNPKEAERTKTEKELEERKKREAPYLIGLKGTAAPWYTQKLASKAEIVAQKRHSEDPISSMPSKHIRQDTPTIRTTAYQKKTIEEMRLERLEREKRERERAEKVIRGENPDANRLSGKYHSQFNPRAFR